MDRTGLGSAPLWRIPLAPFLPRAYCRIRMENAIRSLSGAKICKKFGSICSKRFSRWISPWNCIICSECFRIPAKKASWWKTSRTSWFEVNRNNFIWENLWSIQWLFRAKISFPWSCQAFNIFCVFRIKICGSENVRMDYSEASDVYCGQDSIWVDSRNFCEVIEPSAW